MKKHSVLKAPVLATVLATFFCCVGITKEQQQKRDISSSILSNFPGYHLLTLEERDRDARAFIIQHFSKANPSVVHADFDGDSHQDYALLLKNDKSELSKLVVLLCPEDERCRSVFDLDISAYSGSVYLRAVARGSRISQTESIERGHTSAPVNLKCTGIRVTYFGKGEVVLYWNNKHKKIEEIATAD
jgi:hypothetical protein